MTWAERADAAIREWHRRHGSWDPADGIRLTLKERVQIWKIEQVAARLRQIGQTHE